MNVGVLALQGDFREHLAALAECGVSAQAVKTAEEIEKIDALVIPGGESTTISKLAKTFNLFNLIKKRISEGLPTYGSCAGMILLADRLSNPAPGQETFGGLDISVRRNAFGRQIDSFESDLDFAGAKMHAVFIRAPWVEAVGKSVEVLATVLAPDGQSHPVAVRQGALLATSFHPELTNDLRVHSYFFDEICQGAIK